MIERHPVIAALLTDGLQRAYEHPKIGFWLKKRLNLIFTDSIKILESSIFKPDIIYLDPMYPIRTKRSLPKKNMQILRLLIGYNNDYEKLLYMSRKLAKRRIVIKRPAYAKPISKETINFFIHTKNHRFDIYCPF